MKKSVLFLFLLLFTIPSLSGCGNKRDSYQPSEYCGSSFSSNGQVQVCSKRYNLKNSNNESVYPFDTSFYLNLIDKEISNSKVNELETLIGSELFRMHKLFDRHYDYYSEDGKTLINNIKRINESYGTGTPIKVDDDLYKLLKESVELTKITDGKFNIAIGELSTYWEDFINEFALESDITQIEDPVTNPTQRAKIEKMLEDTPTSDDIDQVLTFDDNNKTVTFNKYKNAEKVSLTTGAIGKGYATELIADELAKTDYTKSYFNSGYSSIVVLGPKPKTSSNSTNKWGIGIKGFNAFSGWLGYIQTNERMGISTSGDTERAVETIIDNKLVIRSHIVNPITGYPCDSLNNYRKVTLYSKKLDASILDACSTMLMNVTSIEEAHTYAQKIRDYYNCDLDVILYHQGSEGSVQLFLSNSLKGRFITYSDSEQSFEVSYHEI